jgi:macrolide transport system ATP-binding/permease protein
MDHFWADVRYAARLLAKAPGATLATVLSLALGIGANTTLFTWLSAVMLRPFPGVPEAERLLELYVTDPNEGYINLSHPEYRDYRDGARQSAVIAFDDQALSLSADGQSERIWGLLVSGNYFDVVGVKPALGRAFRPDEDVAPGRDAVVVLSHALWQRRFGGDPQVVGRTVRLNTHPFTVIGVAPPAFVGTRLALSFDAYVPLAMQGQVVPGGDRLAERGDRWLRAMARLAPGVSLEQAQAELSTIAARLGREYPADAGRRVEIFPVWNSPSGGGRILTPVLLVLSAVAALVLLIACANVANLLLARATARGREVAVRLSLGASRGRLVQQLLTESALLALMGGAAGLLIALWCSPLLRAFVPPTDFPIDLPVAVDGRALAFTLAVSLLTGLLFGLAPALHASRPALASVLRDDAGTVTGARRARLRHGLVVTQVALSMVLLVSAGLFLRSLRAAQAFSPGFEVDGVLLASVDLFPNGYDSRRGVALQERLLERVRGLPEVRAASLGRRVPLSFGGSSSFNGLRVEGYTPPPDQKTWSYVNQVGSDYFRTLAVPILRGRDIAEQDGPEAPRVVVINECMALRYWPGREALGGHITFDDRVHTVVGVVRDFTFRRLGEEAAPYMFLPLAQYYAGGAVLHVRTAGDPLLVAPALREIVRELDPGLPLFGVRTLRQASAAVTFQHRLGGTLLGAFGVLALLLATVGLGSVLAYMVGQRTREIGVRMALGGDRSDVFRLVLRRGMGLTGLGMAIGLAAALAATRPLGGMLFHVSASDPLTVLAVALLLAGAALLACLFPARRAMNVDPLVALRHE